jgi:PAS domain S-box-containing protein
MTSHTLSIVLFVFLVLLFGMTFLWYVTRRYRSQLGDQKETQGKASETAFIINAFHQVTKQLKEKEKELERLKALAEQRADTVENYNENILQCVTSGVMTFDKDCRLTTMNRAAEETLGINREGSINSNCRDLFGTSDIIRVIKETLERNAPSDRMEAMLERPLGKLWLGYNTAVLTDQQKSPLGVILSFSDLTEVKRLHEQVELRERLTALGEMSAGIAHELRNPMAVISGYLNLLAKKTPPEQQAIIRDISTEINGMNRIIGDLLTFARPASLNRVKINLTEIIESCLANTLQATDAAARITAIVKLDPIETVADEVLMRQAFMNLIQNAIEAIPEQGTITIEAARNHELRILIQDTGIGIPADQLKKVFLPFYTTKDKGTGLGLALVHKIILSHGGRIELESAEGKGSLFTVILPKG